MRAEKKSKLDDAYVESLTSAGGGAGWQTGPVADMAIDEPETEAEPSMAAPKQKGSYMQPDSMIYQ